jgi:hypothetical protein
VLDVQADEYGCIGRLIEKIRRELKMISEVCWEAEAFDSDT